VLKLSRKEIQRKKPQEGKIKNERLDSHLQATVQWFV